MTLLNSSTYEPHPPDPGRKTAVLIVAGRDTPAEQAFKAIRALYGDFYSQVIFLSVGLMDYAVIDAQDFKGSEVPTRLKEAAHGVIQQTVNLAKQAGMETLICIAVGTDPADAVERQAGEISKACPGSMFFMGKLVFPRKRWWHAFLHGSREEDIQNRLERRGLPLGILPVLLPG
jgi:hypothetical protein